VNRQQEEDELVQVLAKAEADPTGFTRGRRHTMLDDSEVNHTRHARAVVGGVLASVCGNIPKSAMNATKQLAIALKTIGGYDANTTT
jgi:uncharacterized membrane protein